jgi:hypothetical protein
MLKKTLLLLLVSTFFACDQTPKTLANTIDFSQIKSIISKTNLLQKYQEK